MDFIQIIGTDGPVIIPLNKILYIEENGKMKDECLIVLEGELEMPAFHSLKEIADKIAVVNTKNRKSPLSVEVKKYEKPTANIGGEW